MVNHNGHGVAQAVYSKVDYNQMRIDQHWTQTNSKKGYVLIYDNIQLKALQSVLPGESVCSKNISTSLGSI